MTFKLGFAVLGILFIVGAILGGLYLYDPQIITSEAVVNDYEAFGIPYSPALSVGNITLTDHSVIDLVTNTCYANQLGMNILIDPCTATYFGDVEHRVNFTWNGAVARNITWVFVYEGDLEEGSIGKWTLNAENNVTVEQDQWINDFLVTDITSYTNLGTPTESCDFGSINNDQMYSVTRNNNGTYTENYCFTDVNVINANTFEISGNRTVLGTEIQVYDNWVDVTGAVESLGSGLLGDPEYSFYKVREVTFQPNETIETLWNYVPTTNSGKWHILGYETETGLINSINSETYIYLDPAFNGLTRYEWYAEVDNAVEFHNAERFQTFTVGTTGSNVDFTVQGVSYLACWTGEKTHYAHIYPANNDTDCDTTTVIASGYLTSTGNGFCNYIWSNMTLTVNGTLSASTQYCLGMNSTDTGNSFWNQDRSSPTYSGGTADDGAGDWQDYDNNFEIWGVLATASTPVDILYPTNTSYVALQTLLNYSAETGVDCWYSTDGGSTNSTSVACGINFTGLTSSGGSNTWTLYGNSSDNLVNSTSVTFTVNIFAPNVTITAPTNTTYSSAQTTLNYTISPNGADCWTSTNGGITNSTSQTCGINFTLTSSENNNTWYLFTNSSDNLQNNTQVTFTVDSIAPTITIHSPVANWTNDSLPTNVPLNYTANDTNLDTCYYNTSESATINVITCGALTNIAFTSGGNKTISAYANDSAGTETLSLASFWLHYYNSTQNISQPFGIEGEAISFNLTINMTDLTQFGTQASFVFNNTQYTPTNIGNDENQSIWQMNLTIPSDAGASGGASSNWNWIYNITDIVTNYHTANDSFVTYSLGVDDCSTFPKQILNYTLRRESTNAIVDVPPLSNTTEGHIEVDVSLTSIGNASVSFNYSKLANNVSEIVVCVNDGILNNSNVRLDATAQHKTALGITEFHYIQNYTQTSSNNQSVSLMNLLSADSTSFLFTYSDTTSNAVPNAIVKTFRKYVGEGLFREVEGSKLDENGETAVHLDEEDAIYTFEIWLEGTKLFTSTEFLALCQTTPCTVTFQDGGTVVDFGDEFDNLPDGSYTISANKSNRVVTLFFNFGSSTGIANLTAYEYSQNETEFDTAVASSSTNALSGTLDLTIPQTFGNKTFYVVFYKDDVIVTSRFVDFTIDPQELFATTGLFIVALIILTFGLMASPSGSGVIVFSIIAVFFVAVMGFFKLYLGGFIMLAIAGGVILYRLLGRRE